MNNTQSDSEQIKTLIESLTYESPDRVKELKKHLEYMGKLMFEGGCCIWEMTESLSTELGHTVDESDC